MKIKTADLVGPALDWVVAQCEKEELSQASLSFQIKEYGCLQRPHLGSWKPSSSWAQGGPIIERESLTLRVNANVPSRWVAFIDFGGSNCNIKARQSGPTPLIAAMRCYVATTLGDEVDIPEELL